MVNGILALLVVITFFCTMCYYTYKLIQISAQRKLLIKISAQRKLLIKMKERKL